MFYISEHNIFEILLGTRDLTPRAKRYGDKGTESEKEGPSVVNQCFSKWDLLNFYKKNNAI